MAERDSHETCNVYLDLIPIPLSDQQTFRLNKINEIRYYFIPEMKERELRSKRLSKYTASFDYFDKSLIALSLATSSISIASFATVIRAPVGIANATFSLEFSISAGIVEKLLKSTGNRKKNTSKLLC